MTIFKTCRGCNLKDTTSRWRDDAHAVLCVTCHLDAKTAAAAAAAEVEPVFVTFSPAALRAAR